MGTGPLPPLITDSFLMNSGEDVQNQYDSMIYHSKVEQASLAVRFKDVATRILKEEKENNGAASIEARQLSFDFFAQSRVEEVAMFRQRNATTVEGLDGTQRETFIQQSRRVAARFEMSMSVSGAVLDGFAGAAEGLKEIEGEALDRLMSFTDKLLDKADEIINDIFELLDGFFKGNGVEDGNFEDHFNKLMNDLLNLDFGTFQGPFEAPQGIPALQGSQVSQFGVQLEFKFEFSMSIQVEQAEIQQSDPITFDLDGDGIELSSYKQGAWFDILGSGQAVNTAFVTGGDAFLAIDRNKNGAIDSGKELFGDQNGAVNGFEELKKLDSNKDGLINASDKDFGKLLLFRDNGNGKTEEGELISLEKAGITELSLNYRNVNMRAAGGNRIGQIASYQMSDGKRGMTADTILNFTT